MMKNIKWSASITTIILGILVLLSYLVNKTIPMTRIYLGEDRIEYSLIVFILAMAGIIFFWLAKKDKIFQILKIISYLLALILIVGFQMVVFIRSAGSFRGFEWALENLIIGLIPIGIVFSGLLILKNKRIVGLVFTIVFSLITVYHLTLAFKILPKLGRAFSSSRTEDLLINLVIILYSAASALINYKFYRNRK